MEKIVDALYKKILILLAIAGGSWVYGIKFYESNFIFSFLLFFIFLFVSVIIIKNYVEMNKIIKKMKKEMDERDT
jgi:hypothetical protein